MHWILDHDRRVDHSLTALLVLQGLTLFVVIPFAHEWPVGRTLLDICHILFAVICVTVLTRNRPVQALLVTVIAILTGWPLIGPWLSASLRLDPVEQHEAIAAGAFVFNAAVTAVVAQTVFAQGRVTKHRVRGAVLLYLNVSALFAIAYGAIAMHTPDAFAGAVGHGSPAGAEGSTAAFTYFSLTTITTTGLGDVTPLSPLARSLVTLEAVFGQLFPATLLARLVALHLAHDQP